MSKHSRKNDHRNSEASSAAFALSRRFWDLTCIAVATLLAFIKDVSDRQDEEHESVQEVDGHLQTDHPRRVYPCKDRLGGVFDDDDLAAWDLADGGIFGGDPDSVQPVEFGGLLSLSSAVAASGVVVKGDAHGCDWSW